METLHKEQMDDLQAFFQMMEDEAKKKAKKAFKKFVIAMVIAAISLIGLGIFIGALIF